MISIFSKFKIAGGSERRCVELANAIAKYSGQDVKILCRETSFPNKLHEILSDKVNLVLDCLNKPEEFYSSDKILTVNTDSREFASIEYWKSFLDLEKMRNKTMIFLFNFIISPSKNLNLFEEFNIKLGIITTNKKFYDEISSKDKFLNIRHLPRIILESPIDPEKMIISNQSDNSEFNINFLSKSYSDKWNDDILPLVKFLSSMSNDHKKIKINLMGVKHELRSKLSDIENVYVHGENAIQLNEFFKKCNLFIFYPSYKREEPWARVIGEAMSCGVAIIALNNSGGTELQVINENNGFLCKNLSEFIDKCVLLITDNNLCKQMGKNSLIYSKYFSSEMICRKLLMFIDGVST